MASGDSSTGLYTFELYKRCYLRSHPYFKFPSDALDSWCMDRFNDAVRKTRGHSHAAPLNSRERHLRLLDIGTGTGRWAIKMGEKYRGAATVTGIDVARWQPETQVPASKLLLCSSSTWLTWLYFCSIPPNVSFEVMDVNAPLTGLDTGSWDLVHVRCMYGAVKDWDQLYSNIRRCLTPGIGHIEHIEIDWNPKVRTTTSHERKNCAHVRAPSPSRMTVLPFWASTFYDCMDQTDTPARVDPPATRAALERAGLVDVKHDTYLLPLSRESWDPHNSFPVIFSNWIEALTLRPFLESPEHTFSEAFVRRLVEDAKAELASYGVPVYCTMHVWTAMRPQHPAAW